MPEDPIPQENYWIFQANPNYYDLAVEIQRMSPGDEGEWAVNQYPKEMCIGDKAILWQSGSRSGIYAFVELVGLPTQSDGIAEWQIAAGRGFDDPGLSVRFLVTHIPTFYIPRSVLKADMRLDQLSIFRMASGTNFRVSLSQWAAMEFIAQSYVLDGEDQTAGPIGGVSKKRNPTWARDEIILALDLYFKRGRRSVDEEDKDVIQLSQFLNALPIHPADVRGKNFRNPAGVAMKIGNLMAFDPQQTSGLPAGGKGDKAVWDEFSGRPRELHQLAQTIRQGALTLSMPTSDSEEEDEEFPEGKIIERLHKRRERNRKLVTQKLKQVQQATGSLACEACGFDFMTFYGPLGKGFAECHHIRPLSEVGEGNTKLRDLAIVCANCHRMIHRSRPMLTPAAIKSLLS